LLNKKMPTPFSSFSPLTPRSRWREFFANLGVLVRAGQPAPRYFKLRPLSGKYADIPRGRFPGRGLLYSFLAHEIVILAILTVSTAVQLTAAYRRMQRASWRPDEKLMYLLPELGGGASSDKPAPTKPETKKSRMRAIHESPEGEESASAPSKPGLVYPAPQRIISNPPNPTNRIQTVLQPELVKPPTLKVPLALPNMVTIARLTAPRPDYAPKLQAPTPQPAKTPSAPSPALAGPERHPLSWHFVNVQPTAPPPEAPQLTLPEVTSHKFGPLPQNPHPVIKVPKVNQPATAAAPEAPELKPEVARNMVLAPPGIHERPVTVPVIRRAPSTSGEATPRPETVRLKPELGGGTDAHSVLVLSPTPGAPTPNPAVPLGEARGQFAMGPEPNLKAPPGAGIGLGTGAGGSPGGPTAQPREGGLGGGTSLTSGGSGEGKGAGSGTSKVPGSAAGGGGGTGAGGAAASAGPGTGAGGGKGTGSGTGTGNGSGTGPGTSPFAGISIAGGSGTTVSASHPTANPTKTQPAPHGTYGMSIVSTASSGGGLRDFGIFRNETVYTVYIEAGQSQEPSWTLQYAEMGHSAPDPTVSSLTLSSSGDTQRQFTPPYPIDKEEPKFPADVVARNSGRVVVIAGVITAEGKFGQLRIIQSPNTQLNAPALEALSKWSFRPAERAGQPVALKILLGIPLPPSPQ
jgi:TonB family protein